MKYLDFLLIVIGVIVFLALALWLNSYSVMLVWNWLANPILALPKLTIFQAFALTTVYAVFTTPQYTDTDDKKAQKVILARIIWKPLVLILIAYILKSYI